MAELRIGCLVMALGISLEVAADVIMLPGEAFVRALSHRLGRKFGNVKVALDVALVSLSILTSLAFVGRLEGVREGTVAAAFCVGLLTKQFLKPLQRLEKVFFT